MAEIWRYTSIPTDVDILIMNNSCEEKTSLDDFTHVWPKNHLIKIERGYSSQIPDGFYKSTRVIQCAPGSVYFIFSAKDIMRVSPHVDDLCHTGYITTQLVASESQPVDYIMVSRSSKPYELDFKDAVAKDVNSLITELNTLKSRIKINRVEDCKIFFNPAENAEDNGAEGKHIIVWE